jgi:hypothetical protein
MNFEKSKSLIELPSMFYNTSKFYEQKKSFFIIKIYTLPLLGPCRPGLPHHSPPPPQLHPCNFREDWSKNSGGAVNNFKQKLVKLVTMVAIGTTVKPLLGTPLLTGLRSYLWLLSLNPGIAQSV